MATQRIRIKLKSYDHNLIDKSAERIVRTVKQTGAAVSGPIPLPTEKTIYTVHKRLIDISSSNSKTIDSLMRLEIPAGVDVEVKV